jgi:hypothetical protein
MSCTADPLMVPAHRVITLAVDWEAHDLDKGLVRSAEQVAGVACIDCGTDYRRHPEWPQVVAGLAGAAPDPEPLVACRGTCAARHGSATGTGQPVPPIENRILLLKQLSGDTQLGPVRRLSPGRPLLVVKRQACACH